MDKIRIAICDDSQHIVEFLKMKLNIPEFELVGAAYTATSCIKMLKTADADVLLIDVQMETETAGIDIIPQIKEMFPDLIIIILTGFDDDDYVFQAFVNGANNYIMKSFEMDITQTIKDTYDNTFSLDPNIAQKLVKRTKKVSDTQSRILFLVNLLTKLSTAEYEVLLEICDGAKYKEIAAQRFVELSTIKTHAQRILKKTGASSMKDLVSTLQNFGIIELLKNKNS